MNQKHFLCNLAPKIYSTVSMFSLSGCFCSTGNRNRNKASIKAKRKIPIVFFVALSSQVVAQDALQFPKDEKVPHRHHVGNVWINDCLKIKCKMKRLVLFKIACTLSLTFWAGFAFSQPVIKIKGSKNAQMIKQQVKLYLDQLDVQENFHLTIIFSTQMPDKLEGFTSSHPSPEPEKYHIIRVLVDAKLPRTRQLLVLAHEMIHVKQYVKNELLILDDQRVIWKEKEYFLSHEYNRYLPWEDEAYHADLTLVREVKFSRDQM